MDSWSKRGRDRSERLGEATARVRAILKRPDTVLRVACLPDDDDAIIGYAAITAAEPHQLYYVYVRRDARGQGVARRLLVGVEKP